MFDAEMATSFQDEGFDVRAILSPSVAEEKRGLGFVSIVLILKKK